HIYDSCSVLGHVIPFCHFLTCKVILMSCWNKVISTITSIFALAIALITSTSLPVGILLVSYVKNQNGIFKVRMGLSFNYFTITNATLTDENSQGPEKNSISPSNICMY
uniref:Uncharacterized protein n=1 Tax=Naja naja TaxID=35670 RepID=A0A8C6VME4_NAJNA